jgi:uncharacterized membrane protein YdjX (TVP38/TMEM64 family)
MMLAGALVGLVALALAWRYTRLAELVSLESLGTGAEALRASHAAAIVTPVVFVALSLVLVPITVLRATVVLVFGPILGFVYALVGSMVAAFVGHELGRRLGAASLERLFGARVSALRERVHRRGALAVAALRLVPIAPYTVVNAAFGAAAVRRRDFLVGTAIATTPRLVIMALAVSLLPALRDLALP